jgi:phage-related holin
VAATVHRHGTFAAKNAFTVATRIFDFFFLSAIPNFGDKVKHEKSAFSLTTMAFYIIARHR